MTDKSTITKEAEFLIDRLSDFESEISEEQEREWAGHVRPSIARLKMLLLASPSPPPSAGVDAVAVKEALERAADAESTLAAWFDLAKKTEAEVAPVILDGLKGYLRTSRSGGMPSDLSDRVEAVLEDYCDKYLGRALVPVLRGIASTLTPAPTPVEAGGDEALEAALRDALAGGTGVVVTHLDPTALAKPAPAVEALEAARNALRDIERARARYGATGFPVGLYSPDPASWMERHAEAAADAADAALAPAGTVAQEGQALDDGATNGQE